jgi:hypothetical protein
VHNILRLAAQRVLRGISCYRKSLRAGNVGRARLGRLNVFGGELFVHNNLRLAAQRVLRGFVVIVRVCGPGTLVARAFGG